MKSLVLDNSPTQDMHKESAFTIRNRCDKHMVTHKLIIQILLGVLLAACSILRTPPEIPIQTVGKSQTISPSIISNQTPIAISTITPGQVGTLSPTSTFVSPTVTSRLCPPFNLDVQLPDPDIPENYIGRHFDLHNLPDGIEEIGSLVIRQGNIEYGLIELQWTQNRIMWWLDKLVCRNSSGKAFSEIVDTIASPPLYENETIAYICFKDKEKISNPIAVGTFDKDSQVVFIGSDFGFAYKEMRFAFEVDLNAGRFVLLNPEGLECLEPVGLGPEQ